MMCYSSIRKTQEGGIGMARHRNHIDYERTQLLGLGELQVLACQSSDERYVVENVMLSPDTCPRCGSEERKEQNSFSKEYLDFLPHSGAGKIITLEYRFKKYRCLNTDCRHIFRQEIAFASRDDRVTHRLEDEIARLIISGKSYSEVVTTLSGTSSANLSRQAVGQIFSRWVAAKQGRNAVPACLGVITGETDKDYYTLYLDLDNGIRVLDIAYGIKSEDIAAKLRSIAGTVEAVVTDCNPLVRNAVADELPGAEHIIPAEYWFRLVEADFSEYAKPRLRWCPVRHNLSTLLTPEGDLGFHTYDRDCILEHRPELKQSYDAFHRLRRILKRTDELWIYPELEEWLESTDAGFREALSVSALQLEQCEKALTACTNNPQLIPQGLSMLTRRLEAVLSKQRTFSDAQLKAKVLYPHPAEFRDSSPIPLEKVILNLLSIKPEETDL